MSSDKLDNDKSSPDESNFDKEEKVIEENRKKEGVYESLENNKWEVQLEIKKHTFKPK